MEGKRLIAVVDYHKGNLKSVERGLVGVGADARITDDARQIADASAIVLPGVGAFADAATSMRELGQMDLVRERIKAGVPFLGICLGLHLMYEGGEEHAEGDPTPGLGIIPGIVRALPKKSMAGRAYKIPHVGWNSVDYLSKRENPLFKGIKDGEFFYFTHSYVAPPSCEAIATTTHSITFPCVVQVGANCFGVQFHPEKSSDAGAALLRNFVEIASR
jgi:glutamine amidotransferase